MARKEAKTLHGAAVALAQAEADFVAAGGKGPSVHFGRNRDALVEAAFWSMPFASRGTKMPETTYIAQTYGPITYAIPRIGEHGYWSCLFGRHWMSVVRQETTGRPLAVVCGACRKDMGPLHDVGAKA